MIVINKISEEAVEIVSKEDFRPHDPRSQSKLTLTGTCAKFVRKMQIGEGLFIYDGLQGWTERGLDRDPYAVEITCDEHGVVHKIRTIGPRAFTIRWIGLAGFFRIPVTFPVDDV